LRKKINLILFVLFLVNIFVYKDVLTQFFILDSGAWIEIVQGTTPLNILLKKSEFRVVVFLFWHLNFFLFKFNYYFYHLFSLLIHIANSFLVFYLAKEILKRESIWWAFFSALLFSVSYPKYEAIVWISGIGDLYSTFFFLSCLYFF
jgi:hypothetical protein